ncbi:MAG: carbohydrate ABC transporter permease [Bacillota bacterium]|jgi:ABC-type glycerol-3-phosphate transport system permease component|nr:carbohydrate ABC transporter permease [Bacillota bacterium]HHT91833.1 carbohydrate ABC transporter permease [Bacillota bacterium]
MKLRISNRRLARSVGGDIFIFMIIFAMAAFMALPLVYTISQALKPLNEIFLFPPQFFPRHPTLDNFSDLFLLMAQSWVPITRYLFNSLVIVILGTAGNVLLGSLCAYALAKHDFPGKGIINSAILLSLMFAGAVLLIPHYLTMAYLNWIDSLASIIVPAWGATLGVFLMRNFIDHMVHDSLLEASRIDGASEFKIWWTVVMPIVKPAWLTLTILSFQSLWGDAGGQSTLFIYREELKPLPYALSQIIGGGVGRAGVAAAVTVILMAVPITVFIINQSQIVQTMGTSGITGE